MIFAEQELCLVLNRVDDAEGFVLASSTWPRWTRFLDRLVAAGLAACQDIRDREGRRIGGRYRIKPDAITLVRKRRLSAAELEFRKRAAARLNDAKRLSRTHGGVVPASGEVAQDTPQGVQRQTTPGTAHSSNAASQPSAGFREARSARRP